MSSAVLVFYIDTYNFLYSILSISVLPVGLISKTLVKSGGRGLGCRPTNETNEAHETRELVVLLFLV